jgi:hypothetical protein
MEGVWDFLGSWTFLIICLVAFLALIGVFIFLRSRKTED